MENFPDFVFDDEKPKKKKKPKKPKKKPPPPTKEFYEAKLVQLNERLASLRKRFTVKDEENRKLASDLVSIEEDRIDVCEYLERTIKDRKGKIVELNSTLNKLQSKYEAYKSWSEQKVVDIQKQFTVEHAQFMSEIKLQKQALKTLDEYRLKRDRMLAEHEKYRDGILELQRQTREDLFSMEQKAVVQKSNLKKQVEVRLENLVQDFLHSKEIRNAGFTRNLIQENITLKRNLDKLVKTNIRAIEERQKQIIKTKEIMESYTSLEQLTNQLERTIENKNNIIERLNSKIDRMRTRYIEARRYRRLYDRAKERQMLTSDGPKNFQDVVEFLDRLVSKKQAILQRQRVQEQEIKRMRKTLGVLHSTIEKTVLSMRKLGPGESLDPTERHAIISELIFLATSDSIEVLGTAAFYRPGSIGFIAAEQGFDRSLNVIFMRTKTTPEQYASDAGSQSFENCKDTNKNMLFNEILLYEEPPKSVSINILDNRETQNDLNTQRRDKLKECLDSVLNPPNFDNLEREPENERDPRSFQ